MMERLEGEFGERRAALGDDKAPGAADGRGAAQPPPDAIPLGYGPERRSVALRLPLSRPRVVYALLAINVLMYGVTVLVTFLWSSGGDVSFDRAYSLALLQLGGKFGPAIDAGEYWRFLTPIVLHGGLIHLGFNSYALFALGPAAEGYYGSARFLAIYLLAGLAGTIASYIRSPGLSIGASGAIFGLLGALAAFFYSARGLLGAERSRQQITQLVAMAGINIVLGLSTPAIDNAAHIGGLVAGGVAGFAFAPHYRIDDRLYPPAVVRTDRGLTSWLLGGGVLVLLIGWALAVIGRY